jgi:hypothetical protein
MAVVVEIPDSLGLMVCEGVGEEVVVVEAAFECLISALRLLDEKRAVKEVKTVETAEAEAEAEAVAEVLESLWRLTSAEIRVGYRGGKVR